MLVFTVQKFNLQIKAREETLFATHTQTCNSFEFPFQRHGLVGQESCNLTEDLFWSSYQAVGEIVGLFDPAIRQDVYRGPEGWD